ncbi:MAG: hypothetical protein QM518_05680 [Verrucomicrobiota bacterium]|nr:hypothetical protein [Verrucomicrobiota bacterium]
MTRISRIVGVADIHRAATFDPSPPTVNSQYALLGSRDGKVGVERTRDGIRRRETGERNRIVAMLKNSAARFERCSEGRVPCGTGIGFGFLDFLDFLDPDLDPDPDFDFDFDFDKDRTDRTDRTDRQPLVLVLAASS